MIKVQYSILMVKDLKESVDFYRDVLGFKEGYHVDLPNGAAITIMESEGASVKLIAGTQFDIGLNSIGTDVDDLDKTLKELEMHGYTPTSPIAQTTLGRMAFILDPNGVNICLIEHSAEYREKYMK